MVLKRVYISSCPPFLPGAAPPLFFITHFLDAQWMKVEGMPAIILERKEGYPGFFENILLSYHKSFL